MEPFEQVGNGFTQQYYATYQNNRPGLGGCYRESSLMSYNGTKLAGINNIMTKICNLPLGTCLFKVESCDCHPSLSGGVIIFIDGELKPEGEEHSLKFAEVFHLAQDNGNWYISNQIFRILGGGSH